MRAIARTRSLLQSTPTRLAAHNLRRASIAVPRSVSSYQRPSAYKQELTTPTTRPIANMSTESTQSKACCDTPAVVSECYQPKGDYIEVDGLKTCRFDQLPITVYANSNPDATGPKDAKIGILVVYDIFGFFNQTLQGADILAYTDSQKYQVFMPDFFEGSPADISWMPPDNDEKKKKMGEFFQTKAAPPKTLPRIPKIVDELSQKKGIEKWAIVGYCWGGKVCLNDVMN